MKKIRVVVAAFFLLVSHTWCAFAGEEVDLNNDEGFGSGSDSEGSSGRQSPFEQPIAERGSTKDQGRNQEPFEPFGKDYPTQNEPVQQAPKAPTVSIADQFNGIVKTAQSFANPSGVDVNYNKSLDSLVDGETYPQQKLALTRFSDSVEALQKAFEPLQKSPNTAQDLNIFVEKLSAFLGRLRQLREATKGLPENETREINAMIKKGETLHDTLVTEVKDALSESLGTTLTKAQDVLNSNVGKPNLATLQQSLQELSVKVKVLQSAGVDKNITDSSKTIADICTQAAQLLAKAADNSVFDQQLSDTITASQKSLQALKQTMSEVTDKQVYQTQLLRVVQASEDVAVLQDRYAQRKVMSTLTQGSSSAFGRFWNNLLALVKQVRGQDSSDKIAVQNAMNTLNSNVRTAQSSIMEIVSQTQDKPLTQAEQIKILSALKTISATKTMLDNLSEQVKSGAFGRSTTLDIKTVLKSGSGDAQAAIDTLATLLDMRVNFHTSAEPIRTIMTDDAYAPFQEPILRIAFFNIEPEQNHYINNFNYLISNFPITVADLVVKASQAENPTSEQRSLLEGFRKRRVNIISALEQQKKIMSAYYLIEGNMSPGAIKDVMERTGIKTPQELRLMSAKQFLKKVENMVIARNAQGQSGEGSEFLRNWRGIIDVHQGMFDLFKILARGEKLSVDQMTMIDKNSKEYEEFEALFIQLAMIPDEPTSESDQNESDASTSA